MITKIILLLLGIYSIYSGIKQLSYFNKGWGIHSFDWFGDNPDFAGEKPFATKTEKTKLSIQAILYIILGLFFTILGFLLLIDAE